MDSHKSKICRFNEAEFKKNYRPILIAFFVIAIVFAAFFIWYIFLYLPDVIQIHEANRPFWALAWIFLILCFEIVIAGGSVYIYLKNKRLLKRSFVTISDKEVIFLRVKSVAPKWQMRLMWPSIRKDYFDKDEYIHYEKIYLGKYHQIRKTKFRTLIVTGTLPYEEIIEMDLDLSDPLIVKKGEKIKLGCRIPAAFEHMDEIEKMLMDFSR